MKLRLCTLLLLLIGVNKAMAYSWILPSKTETSVTTIVSMPVINCANISYSLANDSLTGQLGVICWDKGLVGGATPGFKVFDDKGHSVTYSGYTTETKLDVLIGNGITAGGASDYRVAVVYENTSGGINLDIFDITGAGTSSMVASKVVTRNLSSAGHNPRIDIMGEATVTSTYNSSYPTGIPTFNGLPNCAKFVASFEDNSGNIHGYYADLNLFWGVATVTIPHSGTTYFTTADVAAIQKVVSGSTDDYALFTFMDTKSGSVYKAAWDVSTGAVISPAPIIVPTAGVSYNTPRIDALDDYTLNSSSTQANYQIVADEYNSKTGIYYIAAYNNYRGLLTPVSSTYLDGEINHSSCVAIAPNALGSFDYRIAYWTSFTNPNGFGGQIPTQSISGSTGFLANSNFYEVNNASVAGPTGATRDPLAISSTCNMDPTIEVGSTLVTWTYNNSIIFYKYTGGAIAFKQAPGATLNSSTTITAWPNPATDKLTIGGLNKGDNYLITDLSGKTVLQGTITGQEQQIDISKLAAGMYILHTNDRAAGSIQFVKR